MRMTRTNVTRTLTTGLLAALATTFALSAAAQARPPLREVEEIDRNMLWVGMAIEISDNCPTIDARTLKGLGFLASLRSRALELGYTNGEIRAYVDSDEEKARIRQQGEAYMKSQGLDPTVEADVCALGTQEIARNSQIGALLRAK